MKQSIKDYAWKLIALGRKIKKLFKKDKNKFLKGANGIIHIGANSGQERGVYDKYGLHVIWIEPIQEIFDNLQKNIESYPKQTAYKELITDCNDKEYDFHIANNEGGSSSIFDFKDHKDIWPEVVFERSIKLKSITLPSLIEKQGIDIGQYQVLLMDTQGSELLILKGAQTLLKNFKFIKTEVADFEAYEGCCQLNELEEFMKKNGFREFIRTEMAKHKRGGKYYDIVYKKSKD